MQSRKQGHLRDESEASTAAALDKHWAQASCLENKYQTFDMTFIFHSVSASLLLEIKQTKQTKQKQSC